MEPADSKITFFHTKTETNQQQPQEQHEAENDINSTDKDKQTNPYDKFWAMVDQEFEDITKAGKSAFVINRGINVIIVIVGVAIIGSALSYTWIKGIDPWSTLTTGIGIGSFVIVFFNNPQTNINKAVASLASVYMIYKGHKIEFDGISARYLSMYDDQGYIRPEKTTEMKELNKILEDSTSCYVELVNSHLKVVNADTSKSKDQSIQGNSKKPDDSSKPPKA